MKVRKTPEVSVLSHVSGLLAGELGALPPASTASSDLLLATLHCFWAGSWVAERLAGMRTFRQSATACLPTLLLGVQHCWILHRQHAFASARTAQIPTLAVGPPWFLEDYTCVIDVATISRHGMD